MSQVSEILKLKGGTIFSVTPYDTVKSALKFMAEKNLGAVIVLDCGHIAGIFSERDFARYAAKNTIQPDDVLIKDLMTSHLVTVSPSQTTDECMTIMTSKRIRHLPVVENDALIGLISIGDVVNRIIEDHKFSITQLENYVTGGGIPNNSD